MSKIFKVLTFSIVFFNANGQSTFVPQNQDYYQLIERYEIKAGKFLDNTPIGFRPVTRKSVVLMAEKAIYNDSTNLRNNYSAVDKANLQNFMADSWEWVRPEHATSTYKKRDFGGILFKRKADVYSYNSTEHDLHVSPIFNFNLGTETNNAEKTFINTRGIEIRGTINRKLGFYTMLTENQILGQEYIKQHARKFDAFPYEGFVKLKNKTNQTTYADFFHARGYITFNPLKAVQLQFGHDKNFVGHGNFSTILSDFSAPYLFLKSHTSIGRFHYSNLFTQMVNKQADPKYIDAGDQSPIPPKYMVMNRLDLNITKNFNIGLYDVVMFGNRKTGPRFDLNYVNPIIFYRFVEGHIGSPDNAIVGVDAKLIIQKKLSLYGQFSLDEFVLDSIQANPGYKNNKFGLQLGLKYIDVAGIKNLDFNIEHNRVRPYTYQHFTTYSNFVNYNQPLAHPYGANFKQTLLIIRYQPLKNLHLSALHSFAVRGADYDQQNWGGNITRNYQNSPREYGNVIGQGETLDTGYTELNASYMVLHNLFADLTFISRNEYSRRTENTQKNQSISFGLRWNIARRQTIY